MAWEIRLVYLCERAPACANWPSNAFLRLHRQSARYSQIKWRYNTTEKWGLEGTSFGTNFRGAGSGVSFRIGKSLSVTDVTSGASRSSASNYMPENSSHGIEIGSPDYRARSGWKERPYKGDSNRAIFGIRTESIFRLEPELAASTDTWNSLRCLNLFLYIVLNSTIQQTINPHLI